MKLIRVPEIRKTKQIEYFGLTLTVPDEAKYISIDQDGEIIVWFSIHKPYVRMYTWGVEDWVGEVIEFDLGQVDLEDLDWRETLVELEYEEDDDI